MKRINDYTPAHKAFTIRRIWFKTSLSDYVEVTDETEKLYSYYRNYIWKQ